MSDLREAFEATKRSEYEIEQKLDHDREREIFLAKARETEKIELGKDTKSMGELIKLPWCF